MNARAAAMPSKTLRLLVVDDHELARAGLVSILESEPGFDVVGTAAAAGRRCSLRASSNRMSCSWISACRTSMAFEQHERSRRRVQLRPSSWSRSLRTRTTFWKPCARARRVIFSRTLPSRRS